MQAWKGKDLIGTWIVSRKIDGVHAHRTGETTNWVSRNGKPLYNLEHLPADLTEIEVFCGSWEDSISAVKTKNGPAVQLEYAYSLDPMDERLLIGEYEDPTKEIIRRLMESVVESGYEGIVLEEAISWPVTGTQLKVKPIETHDVAVLGTFEGTGRHKGLLGGVVTQKGNVSAGFTLEQRRDLKDISGGTIIEVVSNGLTPGGKFRHPRFIRVREDK